MDSAQIVGRLDKRTWPSLVDLRSSFSFSYLDMLSTKIFFIFDNPLLPESNGPEWPAYQNLRLSYNKATTTIPTDVFIFAVQNASVLC
mmetsp:Transcript_17179/g.47065  ORF Transcript_17179/g.47065 Transcript_17179/m.47065 type:complete len:88 (-) Transcript_17179:96-359(-)